MWLVCGLGNPGSKYALTRHNVGFMAVDFWAQALGGSISKKDFKAEFAKFKIDDVEVALLKPQTYMNLSGESVVAASQFFKIPLDHFIILQDDIDQPFGQIRIQKNRGHGGHNGIRDISEKMGTADYVRIKIGVGRPENPNVPVADYVLQKFNDIEMAAMTDLLNKVSDAIEMIIFEGHQKAANTMNTKDGKS